MIGCGKIILSARIVWLPNHFLAYSYNPNSFPSGSANVAIALPSIFDLGMTTHPLSSTTFSNVLSMSSTDISDLKVSYVTLFLR